ncbi:hypothetical protein Y025_5227 [Burkholderia pseudomallei TSV32]|nr:hypothetical protein Y025_5227 [Burkholderia pseudomallei TSV32]
MGSSLHTTCWKAKFQGSSYRALGLPIFPSSLREFYTLSKRSIFRGQVHSSAQFLMTAEPYKPVFS